MGVFPDEAFTFYEGLEADNSKTYWLEHKHIYESAVRAPMQALLDELAPVFDGDISIFRPYRDVRFSKDKSPYKTAQGGFIETEPGIGYYLQIDASGVLIGGGFYSRDREQTARYRASVDSSLTGPALVAVTSKLEKAGFTVGGEQVKTRPRGVPADHPRLDLMRREHVTVSLQADPEDVTVATVRKHWTKIKPLLAWGSDNAAPTL